MRLAVPALSLIFAALLLIVSMVPVSLAETDTRAVTRDSATSSAFRKLSERDAPSLKLGNDTCSLPGAVITLSGDDMTEYANYHLALRAEKQFVALKLLSISQKQLLLQVPRDTALKPGERYSVYLLPTSGANVNRKTGLSLKLCPAISSQTLLARRVAHESGEILILANSGLVDQIIQQGARLGYLLLRRHQLDSINETLLVLGGSDKKLAKAIKKLSATFADAEVDYNHLYDTAEGRKSSDSPPSFWPVNGPCQAHHRRVAIGMLDGEIDLAHPALAAKSIKTRQFLLPAQQADQDHATAIAVLLVGNRPEQGFRGLVPFVDLKAATVVRQDSGQDLASAEAITRALDWFINEKVKLVNVSLTSPNANRVADKMFAETIDHGLTVFAAAGNDHQRLASAYPAALPGVIAITAVDANGALLNSANQGDYIDFAAPGVDIWTTSQDDSGQYRSGTSLAVPHAVSIAALYLSQQANLSTERLFENMQYNAIDLGAQGYDRQYGWGQLKINEQLCLH